jgi:hypothetical protein
MPSGWAGRIIHKPGLMARFLFLEPPENLS